MLDQKVISEIESLFSRHAPDVVALYLFGSQAEGRAGPSSDVDLAFLQFEKPSGELLYTLKTEISFLTKKDVDLVDLFRADLVTASQVVSTGQLLFCKDQKFVDHYETVIFSRYAAFNEERKEILEAVRKKGTIHDG